VSAMPGFLLSTASVVTCSHLGTVTITPTQHRALVGGAPIACALDTMLIGGCPASSPSSPPCTTLKWTGLAGRILVGGQFALLQTTPPAGPVPGDGTCVGPPPTTPLVTVVQLRVSGT
jgi:hypothetical protein